MWVICVSLRQSIKFKPTNISNARARAQSKINTHRCWNVVVFVFHTGCQLSSAALTTPLECFWSSFCRGETNVLGNLQLTALYWSGGRDFDSCLVPDNFPVPLWVICISLCQSIKIETLTHMWCVCPYILYCFWMKEAYICISSHFIAY